VVGVVVQMKTLLLMPVIWWALMLPGRAEMKCGAAQVKVTPPAGTGIAGYYHFRVADGVLDDLYARALVLDDGRNRAALVTLDFIGTPRELVEGVRAAVEKASGIPAAQVMIAATHAHTGPELGGPLRQARKPGAVPVDPDGAQAAYFRGLPELIASSVTEAQQQLAPATVSAVRGDCPDLTFVRRFYMRDGSTGWNPGKLNPDIMLPAGMPDTELQAVFFGPVPADLRRAACRAAFVSFSMHPDTVGGTKFSADYPGVLARLIAGYHGADCVTLFGNGACGNLNHLDVKWPRAQSGSYEAERIGTVLAAAVFRAEKQAALSTQGPLRVKSVTVPVELPAVSAEEVEFAQDALRQHTDGAGGGFMALVRAHRVLDLAAAAGKPLLLEVQVITLGREIAWVSFPGEVFTELGVALKKRSPFARTMPVTLANGNWGYIPDRRSYAEGAYEAVSARVPAGTGERLVDEAVKLLAELHAAP